MVSLRLGLAATVLALAASAVIASPCAPSATALCLSNGRFEVKVAWTDFQGNTGDGQAISLTADTGYFWFFNSSNIELIVKVLDARAINQKFWVFFGALSNVEYTLTVRDSATGTTKTYVNPSGQFASVGDTQAFPGDLVAPPSGSHLAQAAAPKAADDLTPCLGPSTRLGLTNCRFLLHVEWRDSQGRTGEGHAVQLTSDTGYFWFFAETNVELVVKVLDARAIDGHFWVFYGALSNVEYRLTVKDTLTGQVKSYTNAAGAFGSLGDTTAFSSGTSVVAHRDDADATSAEVDDSGGTLFTAGADGSVYILEIPPNAVSLPTQVTMTPLSGMDGFPFAGRSIAGVQLEPEGLFLLEPAILTIQPATPSVPGNRATFSYRGNGDEFILYPGELDPSQVRLHLSHFSGYGHGTFMGEDEGPSACEQVQEIIAGQVGRTTSRYFDSYIQRTQPLVLQLWCGKITAAQFDAAAKPIWEEAWGEVVFPAIDALSNACDPDAIGPVLELGFEYLNDVDEWINDHAFSDLKREILLDKVKAIVLQCAHDAYDRCKNRHDLEQAKVIIEMSRALQRAQLIDDAEFADLFALVEGCLHFDVGFESTLTSSRQIGNQTFLVQARFKSTIPVSLEHTGPHFVLSGSAPINYELLQTSSGTGGCSISYTKAGSTFTIDRLGIDGLSVKLDNLLRGRYVFNADLSYRPGDPTQTGTVVCSGKPPQVLDPESYLKDTYQLLHSDELAAETDDPKYLFLHWDAVLDGPHIAKKDYDRAIGAGGTTVSEETLLTLTHTPL